MGHRTAERLVQVRPAAARDVEKTGWSHQGARDGYLAFLTSRAVSGAALPPIFPAAEPQRLVEAASSQASDETQAGSLCERII